MFGSLSPYSVWDVSPWDGAARVRGGSSLLYSNFLGTVVQTHHRCVSMATQTPIHLTIESSRCESVEMVSGAFSNCHLPTPPFPVRLCAPGTDSTATGSRWWSTGYGPDSRSRPSSLQVKSGVVGGSLFLYTEKYVGRACGPAIGNNKNHTKPLRLLSLGDCPASTTASKVVTNVIIQHSLSGLRHPWNLDCVLTWRLGVSRERVCS